MGVPPLVITGMHRSGTSATARLLQRAGLELGDRLMAPRLDNPLGYYEDLAFSDLNRALVAAGVGEDPRYQPDWAFPDRIVPGRLAPLRPRAAALIAQHGARERVWGFKDPRTAVLLDFYDELAPDARYLFVYRAPWEVVGSLMRTVDRPLHGRAGIAVQAWRSYNERLLEFRGRHRERTVLVHVDAVARRPFTLVRLAQAQLDALAPARLDAGAARDAFEGELMQRTDVRSPLAELLAADHPQAIALYARLQAAADMAGSEPTHNGGPPAVVVEASRGALPLGAVLAGAATDGVGDATLVARAAADAVPAQAADAGIDRLPEDVVAVVFDEQPRPHSLAVAVATLRADPGLGAVLLAAGDAPGLPQEHDPLAVADAGAAIVLRRATWLATRGFAAADPPRGFEAWSFAVGCLAQGIRTARLDGGIDSARLARDCDDLRRRVLERHPALAARRALDAEAERDRVAGRLQQLQTTRSWRLVTRWWRLRERARSLRGSD